MNVRGLLRAGGDRYRRLPWPLKRLLHPMRLALDSRYRRRERQSGRAFRAFADRHGDGLGARLSPSTRGVAMLVASGMPALIGVELFLLQSMKKAGYQPVVLADRDHWAQRYYRLAGVQRVRFWSDFSATHDLDSAYATLDACRDANELVTRIENDVHVGKFTVSTALAALRVGTLDLRDVATRAVLANQLAGSRRYAVAARQIVGAVRPKFVFSVDPGYSPRGELFDACCAARIPTVTWNLAHNAGGLILKRYTAANRQVHPVSLSPASWARIQSMEWNAARRAEVHHELFGTYASGAWYCEVGTQVNKRMLETDELRQRLGLDAGKKTAVLFAHMLWDGTLFYGKDLFANYEEWLIATVRAAAANPAVNWVVKMHPANSVKSARAGMPDVPAEVRAIERRIGALPPHVTILPHTSDISTYSLYRLMDFCLTVRGTVGMEAAMFGIPVLTAGTGRYDRLGFTIDSQTAAEYLNRVAQIQNVPPLTPKQADLAERFAYGLLLRRPLPLRTVHCQYARDATASVHVAIDAVTPSDWQEAPDVGALAGWLNEENSEDYLSPE